jgi:hypothetical protein
MTHDVDVQFVTPSAVFQYRPDESPYQRGEIVSAVMSGKAGDRHD